MSSDRHRLKDIGRIQELIFYYGIKEFEAMVLDAVRLAGLEEDHVSKIIKAEYDANNIGMS